MNTTKLAEILNRALRSAWHKDAPDVIEEIAVAVAAECQQSDPNFRTGEFLARVAKDPEMEKFNAKRYSLLPPEERSARA